MKELQLIRLYFYLCECNDKFLSAYCQRFSPDATPNNEKLTDVELLTIYSYCRRHEGKQSKTAIYDTAQHALALEKQFLMALKAKRTVALSKAELRRKEFVKLTDLDLEPVTVKEVWLKDVPFPLWICKEVYVNSD